MSKQKLGPTFPAQLRARVKLQQTKQKQQQQAKQAAEPRPEPEGEWESEAEIEVERESRENQLKLIEFSRAYSDSNKLKIAADTTVASGQASARSNHYVFLSTDALTTTSDSDDQEDSYDELRGRKLSGERLASYSSPRSSSLKRGTKSGILRKSSSSSSRPSREVLSSSLLAARKRASDMAKAKEDSLLESFDRLKVSGPAKTKPKSLRFYDVHPERDYVQFKHENRFKQTKTPQRHVNVSLMRDRAHLETDYLGPYRLNSDEYVPYGYYVDEFYFQ